MELQAASDGAVEPLEHWGVGLSQVTKDRVRYYICTHPVARACLSSEHWNRENTAQQCGGFDC